MLAHALGSKLLSKTASFEEKTANCEAMLTTAEAALQSFVDRYLPLKTLVIQHCNAGTFPKELALRAANLGDEINASAAALFAGLTLASLFASLNSNSLLNFSRLPDGSTPSTHRGVWLNRLDSIDQQAQQIIHQIGLQQSDIIAFLRRLNQEEFQSPNE